MNTSTGAPGVVAWIRATVASALRGLRATTPTRAPLRASSMAAASPIPFVAPVTMITNCSLIPDVASPVPPRGTTRDLPQGAGTRSSPAGVSGQSDELQGHPDPDA